MKLWCQIYIRRAEDGEESDIHDWTCIHDTRKTDNKLISPVCVIEKNRISTLTFRCRPNSPAYTLLRPENATKCEVWVCERCVLGAQPDYDSTIFPNDIWYEEEQVTGGHVYRYDLFVGHAVDYTPYFADNGLLEASITCVDHMDYLNNGVIPREEYDLSRPVGGLNGARGWFVHFVDEYNDEKREIYNKFSRDWFTANADVSYGSITPQYNYIVDFENVYGMLNERFIERWGGVMLTDYAGYIIPSTGRFVNGVKIRWIPESDFGRDRKTYLIQNGVNLKSLRLETDTSEFYTRIYPVGALKDDGSRVSLVGYSGHSHDPDTAYMDISNASYIQEYGVKAITKEWTDVSTQSGLWSNANDYLRNDNKIKRSYTISVLDLSVINNPLDRFRIGDWHKVKQEDLNIEVDLQIIRIEYDLAQLQNVNLVMGDKLLSATEMQVRQATKNKEKFGEITSLLGGA